jgi:hypothetical protein
MAIVTKATDFADVLDDSRVSATLKSKSGATTVREQERLLHELGICVHGTLKHTWVNITVATAPLIAADTRGNTGA